MLRQELIHKLANDVIATLKTAWVIRDYPDAHAAFNLLRDGIERARMGWVQRELDSTEPGVVHITFESRKYGSLQVRWDVNPDLTRNDEAGS